MQGIMDKLLYEIIPPPRSWSREKVDEWTKDLCQMLGREQVDSVNLPEVVNETREEERVVPFLEKIDNVEYAEIIKKKYPFLNPIPNKICVRMPHQQLLEWLKDANERGVQSVVLVGGEHSTVRYPGPSVLKAAKMIKADFPSMRLGGITIFTRKGEAQRILNKMQSGIDFFVSQIIFETSNVKCVLLDLEKLCRQADRKMPRIFLSVAPASSKVDIEFMQWLGVEFPTAVWSYFMDHEENEITERVFEMLEMNLDEIGNFLSKTEIDIGFNVEQIMYKSRDSGERLLKLVKKKVGHCL
jgi:5,10-methylenetetrahydrofolate reductase